MSHKKNILVIGSSNTDMTVLTGKIPAPGETVLGGEFRMGAGGKGAPMIAAIWGVFIWKEFKGAGKGVYGLLAATFCLFIAGLALIIAAGN